MPAIPGHAMTDEHVIAAEDDDVSRTDVARLLDFEHVAFLKGRKHTPACNPEPDQRGFVRGTQKREQIGRRLKGR